MINNRIFLSILIITAVSFSFSCRSKTVVKKLVNQTDTNLNNSQTKKIDGVMYHLPKTVVQVTIPVKKKIAMPGDFAKFAPCFFSGSDLTDMVKEKKQSFSIDPPSFSSRGVPDTKQTYVIQTKGKYLESKTLFVEYAPGYVLQKGEAESKNETLEFTVKAIATAASVASKLGPLAITSTDTENKKLLENLGEEYSCLSKLETLNVTGAATSKDKVKDDMKAVLTPKPSPSPTPIDDAALTTKVNTYTSRDSNRTEYQKALLVFNNLKDLEELRGKTIQNQGSNPPETFKLMLEKNKEAIDAHRAAFLGLRSKEVWAATFEFTPEDDDDYSDMLFTYSKKYGVCNDGFIKKKSISIGSGFGFEKPIDGTDDTESCDNTTESKVETVWLNVRRSDNQSYLQKIKAANDEAAKEDKSRGWFYRVPADGDIFLLSAEISCDQTAAAAPAAAVPAKYSCTPQSIKAESVGADKTPKITEIKRASGTLDTGLTIAGSQIAFNEMPIAQLGEVASVPASTAGRSSITTIMLDPATGAMKNFKSSSTALIDKSILDDAGKAANSAIDAVDPLNRKKRELEELTTQNEINEQKEIMSNSNSSNTP